MTRKEELEQAIAHMESQRAILGDAVIDTSIAALRQQLASQEQEPPDAELKGERKLVTVMFADISGFTAMAGAMDPEAVRDLVNACFNCLVPIIEKYEGTVDKFIGDEIMAMFGAPTAHENDPERALQSALEIMKALAEFNRENNSTLGMHIGINTGLVIAGGIGSEGRQKYSVMGDAVNLAARLEDASEQGEILVGPDTYRLSKPLFEFKALEPIRVKGRAEPVSIYRLLASKESPGKVRGIIGLESPLVGRETEYKALQSAWGQLQAGTGGIVTIVAEAGLGKSRLVAEMRAAIGTAGPDRSIAPPLQSPTWVEGRCLSYGRSIAYLLWQDLLRALLRVTQEDPPSTVRDTLRQRVSSLCPDRFEQIYPYLGRLMALLIEADAETTLQDLEGEQLKAGTFRAVEALIECTAQQHPLVVVCEDLHWADPTSIELLESLLPLIEQNPLLFICVLRPERGRLSWCIRETAVGRYHSFHTDLWLSPLSAAESTALVGHLLRVEDLPQELRERILGHTEGNPFYIEEIIRSLIDSGAIVRDEATGRWHATRDVADIAIPDTLQGVLMARIDRLEKETKDVLQLASVIGRVFLYRVLEAIAQEAQYLEGKLTGSMRTLQREQMIRERARIPELEYIFKHQLTQEAAYNSLLIKARRLFHRQVAEALEQLFPERIEEQIGLLAYHWERAEDVEKATAYLLQAGDKARIAYAHQEAIDYYKRALAFLDLGEEYEQAARTQTKLGLTYHNTFDFRLARQAFEQSFALWQRAGEVNPDGKLPTAPHAFRIPWVEPTTLDPTMSKDIYTGGLLDQLFSGLLDLSVDMDIVPDVAHSWEVSADGREYMLHLRDDVHWSDGTRVTAGDFEYAWKRTLDPIVESPNAPLLYDIKLTKFSLSKLALYHSPTADYTC